MAADAIDSGAALRKLDLLIEATRVTRIRVEYTFGNHCEESESVLRRRKNALHLADALRAES